MKLSQMEENIRRERKRQIVLTVIAVMAALLFGVMVLPVWGRIDGYLLHPSAWPVTAAVFFLCNAVSLARRTRQHKPERSMHIILTCVAVLLTLFFGVSLVEGLLGIPPLFPTPDLPSIISTKNGKGVALWATLPNWVILHSP